MSSYEATVTSLANEVKSGSARDREKAVDELAQLLNPRNDSANLADLGDKSYHGIFEAVFSFVLLEKPRLYGTRRSQSASNAAASRLSKCATAIRMAAGRGVSKIGRKTLLALIDHITQVLPGPNGDYVPSLLQDYVKALAEVLSRQAHAELLCRKDSGPWEVCIDFFLDIAAYTLPEQVDTVVSQSRASPAPSLAMSRFPERANSTPQSQKRAGKGEGGPLKDALEGLFHLISACNAPIQRRCQEVGSLVLKVLRMAQLSLGSTQTLCFAILNTIFLYTQAEDLDYSLNLVKAVLPLMGFWWRAEKVSQDELIRALRSEICRTILLTHRHIEYLARNDDGLNIQKELEELTDPLWSEYSKRGEPFRLQMVDVTFHTASLPLDYPQVALFGLRLHNVDGESHWAVVQSLAFLEARLLELGRNSLNAIAEDGEQPRKKRRTQQGLSRIRLKLKAIDVGVRRTALQMLPLLLKSGAFTIEEVSELLVDLIDFARDKNTITASWALIACASCALCSGVIEMQKDIWKQLWHLAVRSISLPSTSRAGCVLMHTMLEAEFLSYHEISDDIDSIVTTADINGPGLLCDSSLALMFHILHLRNARLPNASQTTSNHIIRWMFLKWNPDEMGFASFQSIHVQPFDFVNLARASCGAKPLASCRTTSAAGGPFSETVRAQKGLESFNEYLLLLKRETIPCATPHCIYVSTEEQHSFADSNGSYTLKKLILELLYPKLEELNELCLSWTKKSTDGGVQISRERYQSLLSACMIGSMLLGQVEDVNSTQASMMEPLIMDLSERALTIAMDSVEPRAFVEIVLKTLRPCLPDLTTGSLSRFRENSSGLLHLLSKIGTSIHEWYTRQEPGGQLDLMDMDDEFSSPHSLPNSQASVGTLPRRQSQLSVDARAFYIETRERLSLMRIIHEDPSQIGLLPKALVDEFMELSTDELLCSQGLLHELCQSDMAVNPDIALDLIERLGAIVGSSDHQCCEAALVTCIDMLTGLSAVWLQDTQELAERVGDLYNHFIRVCLLSNFFSPEAQISLARLLFALMKDNPNYGTSLGLDSCRTSLFYILRNGKMNVKVFISEQIASVFELFILMVHDEVFVDVLDSLPADSDNVAGIAFRLRVLSNLACRWSTLLRRCTYHIFETPGKVPTSTKYATLCLSDISKHLNLDSPRVLFQLFSRQLLYTWLENDAVDDIPYPIFGFTTLKELLESCQAEAIGLMLMRGQDLAADDLARRLESTGSDLLRRNFATALSFVSTYTSNGSERGNLGKAEDRFNQKLGANAFRQELHIHLVDIIGCLLSIIDQDDSVERYLAKYPDLQYAASNLESMKKIAHSTVKLPPNQQPTSRARYVIHEMVRLTHLTEFQPQDIWSPPLVISIARQLFNSVHPALGSLHACSVLRKLRILISLAGTVALETYCLEMLLNSVRNFLVDSECADDALGISQYLLVGGSNYLSQAPSFFAGYALSTLASLRVFLESSQSSTTQESQFKATMSKAQKFHEWFTRFLGSYTSPAFKVPSQSKAFKSITQSAARIRASGNAEKATAEGKLLLEMLEDQSANDQLLNETSRQLALRLLCSKFSIPANAREDIVETDEDAIRYAASVWKSCEAEDLSNGYLSWAGRVIGRAFSASGEIPQGVLRESRLERYQKIAPSTNGSEAALLSLLQDLVSSPDSPTAGLAEAALRRTITKAIAQQDEPLVVACQQSLNESLFVVSQWGIHRPPPSEADVVVLHQDERAVWAESVASQSWLPQICIFLAQSVPESILLSVLPPILKDVKGFASKAFPFLLHLVLFFELEQQQTIKRMFSGAMKGWIRSTMPHAKENLTLLINAVLYLRTQEYPKESSIADRLHWLEVDYAQAASCASWCGMYKTALLFAEQVTLETTRSSRRSSAARETDIHETLLTIFENIDDPDAYYGLPEEPSLSKVLARVEYENEGTKILAFRGAQYDSHIRRQEGGSELDGQTLVKALSTLGLSGLSHSLLQMQQSLGSSTTSLDSMFHTARRLEIWNLPAPSTNTHHAVTVYKAYQSVHQATDIQMVQSTLYDSFSRTVENLVEDNHTATGMRNQLAALAVLTELDDLLNASNMEEFETILDKFQTRSEWMRSGIYENVSHILSCRNTTMSMLGQHARLLKNSRISVSNIKMLEIRSMLMASGVYRYHKATQESLNIATTLNDLIKPCEDMNLHVDAAIKIETASSLWDHGEMATSIRMLQSIDREASLKTQTIPISKSDLLSKIAQRVSLARLEKPQDIQKHYLEPALKELRGTSDGKDAGMVFHQFATFCDEQLQDPDGLEDLTRLQNLRQAKSEEVAGLKSLVSSTKDTQMRSRYSHVLSKEKQWLDLDEQELRRVEQTRSEFVRLSLENYLLSLIASDEHNNDALRFTALWLERSSEDTTNKAVMRHIGQVPTRKFAGLMNQLTSRLQNQDNQFQKLLFDLVLNICLDHPYHGMYQIWSGTKAKAQQKDEVALSRVRATDKVAHRLAGTKSVAEIWTSIDKASKYYHGLAMDRNSNKYKSGAKIPLKESSAGHNLVNCLAKYRVPPPTMHIEISAIKDYSDVPITTKLEPTMTIASGVSAPKIITAVATNGKKYKQLVKGGHDDLRQDAIMEQVFAAVSSLLKLHRATQQRSLGIRTYKVLPLTATSGLIEFVPDTIPLHEFLMPAHERYYPKDLKGGQCRKDIFGVQNRTIEVRINTYRRVTEKFHPVMRYFFMEYFVDPDDWFYRRLAYTRSTAAISMLGHILGLGDRHGHNILLDTKTGEVVHIDLGVAFEAGRILPVPELVPFRLTRDIVDGMGITKTEGVFRRCCEFTLDALREEQYSIMTILDVLRYDPLYTWTVSPLRLAKLQKARHEDDEGVDETDQSDAETKKAKRAASHLNEPSEADRALEVVRKKLSKTLSVTATVNDLINQATDERNLAVLYSAASTKRPRFADPAAPMASAKARGKLPERIDLAERPSAFQPQMGAKKLVIKNLHSSGARNARVEEYYARTQKELEEAVEAIFAGKRPAVPLERLYRGTEDACRKGNADKVYRMLKERVETHLNRVVLPRIGQKGTSSNIEVLRSVLAEWKTWNGQMILIRSTFSFLDRTYLLREVLPSINDLAISYFRKMAFPSQSLVYETSPGKRVVDGMCNLIDFDRRGNEGMDAALLKDSVMMLHVLGIYVKHFEPVFLQQSEAYFQEFGEHWSASSLKDYISATEKLLRREDHRCIAFNLDTTTEKQLMESAHKILIDNYSDKLLDGGSLSKLLSEKEVESMKGLYELLRLSGIQKKMRTPWEDYIRQTGASIIGDKDKGDEMVLRLLELRRSLDLMIRDGFAKDEDLLWSMRDAFGKFMNDRRAAGCWDTGTSKIGEMTAKYIDMLLRGGIKALPKELLSDVKDRVTAEKEGQASTADEDAELDRQLDQALELFRFIEGKDAFEAFYKKDLARRLLMGRSASQDAERNMLTKLRGECGSNFTHNLEQMFKDQELAKDEMESYRQWCEASVDRKPPVDLHVMILSAAAWPTYPDVRLNLPNEVATQIERFAGYYQSKHTGRTLTWKHSLAHCTIKAKFPKGSKELLVSAFQAVVLMLFNTVPADGFLAYEQISAATGLQGGELERTLQSLACGKARVLSKHPKGRDVKPTDTFTFNKAFTDAKYRVKINQIQLKETKEENKATHERIAQDRRFETQAAIVRIMKSRKTMGHAELVAEVINLTKKRGSVEPAAIKKEIESLIEKDYIEREENAYTYLA
ncbi:Serine/threonine-protein kinase TEL1 [Paramyrothecium foliicola]|nr:Serine/threonine-protein kinase TEL1 [Paramyrothecium foliicola]